MPERPEHAYVGMDGNKPLLYGPSVAQAAAANEATAVIGSAAVNARIAEIRAALRRERCARSLGQCAPH